MAKKKSENKIQDDIVAKINGIYGDGSIMKLGKDMQFKPIDRVGLKFLSLNKALGGGVPRGRIIEIYGPEASSKTTFCLHVIQAFQEDGSEAAFIDTEHSLNLEYAEKLGVDLERMYLSQPDYGEQALEILDFLIEQPSIKLIILDSVAALVPKAELDGEMGDSHMALTARLMSQAMRKITAKAEKNNVTIFFTNQIRNKVGVIFGSPIVTTGGNALKFYASIRIDIKTTGKIIEKGSDVQIGTTAKIKMAKNKTARPFQTVEIPLIFGEGYSLERELLGICIDLDIIERKGSWFKYDGESLGQGQESIIELMTDNPEFIEELKNRIENVES